MYPTFQPPNASRYNRASGKNSVVITPIEWSGMDEDALGALAAKVAGSLLPGDVLVLKGPIGAGKTTFARAAARALGVREAVMSPTYQFARSYEGFANGRVIRVNHLDLFRLEGLDARDALDLDEYLDADSVTFIEWAEPALALLAEPNVVEILYQTPTIRRVRLSGSVAARLSAAC